MAETIAKRIDVVWIDQFDKSIGLTQGQTVSGQYGAIDGSGKRYGYVFPAEPQRPDAGRAKYPLAYITVERQTTDLGKANTYSTIVSDITNTDRPAGNFDSTSDFQVSQASGLTFDVTGGTFTPEGFIVTASSTSAVRDTLSWSVPTGQYDVRLQRATADSSSDQIRDEVQWTALRNIKDTEPVDTAFASANNIAQTQVVIKATDQLNGIVDQLNAVCSSILPDYEPEDDVWVDRITSNCASIARDIWQGKASKKPVPDSRLDIDALETLWQRCQDRLMQFNGVIQGGSAEDALKQVLSNARASKTMIDGVRSVVIDQEKTDVVQHFTPRNSRNFRGSKRFAKQPHALKVRFQNREKGYQQDEVIVYDDGYSADGTNCEFDAADGTCSVATEFETLDTKGIVLGEQAIQHGRYQLATNKLRPENYALDVDIEHLVATPGDLIAVTHDVPIFGLAAGRVKSLQTDGSGNTTGVTLDETLELAADTDYTIRFRLSNGDSVTRDLAQVGADTETQTVTFKSAIATASGPAAGDLAQFGLLDQETVFCIIKGITGGDPDWGATLELVDHAQPAIDDSADSSIPAFESNITENPFTRPRPAEPTVESIASDETVLIRELDGTFSARIVISYKVPSNNQDEVDSVQVRWRKVGEDVSWTYESGLPQQGTVALTPVDQGDSYKIEMRSMSRLGLASQWITAAANHTVIGTSSRPPDVQDFSIDVVNDTAYLSWTPSNVPDRLRFEVRFKPVVDGSATWSSAVPLRNNIPANASGVAVANQIGTYLIKEVDRGLRKSRNAAVVISNVTDVLGLNVVENLQEDPGFNGTRTNIYQSAGYIQLGSDENIDAWTSLDEIDRLDVGTGLAEQGTYEFDETFDLGAVYSSRLNATISVLGVNVTNTLASWDSLSSQESLSGAEASDYDVTLEVRTTTDDPTGSPTWTDWQAFQIGDYTARAFQFRLIMHRLTTATVPRVDQLRVQIDMADRVESGTVTVTDGEASVTYEPAFRAKPEPGHTAEDILPGERVLFRNKTADGFDIKIRDANDALVSGERTVSWVSKGYGKKVEPA